VKLANSRDMVHDASRSQKIVVLFFEFVCTGGMVISRSNTRQPGLR
jgi:hypothetical protein